MLRASSEMTEAISVAWPGENPSWFASARPSWRALTKSLADSIGTYTADLSLSLTRQPSAFLRGEKRQAFLQIERGGYVLQGQAELHHCEGDVGLNSDDEGLRAA